MPLSRGFSLRLVLLSERSQNDAACTLKHENTRASFQKSLFIDVLKYGCVDTFSRKDNIWKVNIHDAESLVKHIALE